MVREGLYVKCARYTCTWPSWCSVTHFKYSMTLFPSGVCAWWRQITHLPYRQAWECSQITYWNQMEKLCDCSNHQCPGFLECGTNLEYFSLSAFNSSLCQFFLHITKSYFKSESQLSYFSIENYFILSHCLWNNPETHNLPSRSSIICPKWSRGLYMLLYILMRWLAVSQTYPTFSGIMTLSLICFFLECFYMDSST